MTRLLLLLLLTFLVAGCARKEAEEARGTGQPPSTHKLQPEKVPEHLRHLVPLAEQWGIGDDVERAESIERASPADRQALIQALAPHQSQITAWLDAFGTDVMSDEAAAFMYMQLAVEEMRS
jgi:hypothetical protein